MTKASGERLPKCDADQMGVERSENLAGGTYGKLFEAVVGSGGESLTEKIQQCDRKIEQIARDKYPEPNS